MNYSSEKLSEQMTSGRYGVPRLYEKDKNRFFRGAHAEFRSSMAVRFLQQAR